MALSKIQRIGIIDLFRGIAILLMAIFHLCFLIQEFNLGLTNFYSNPFWPAFRTLIVSLFLSLVGVSFVLAEKYKVKVSQKLLRIGQITLYALIISIVSYIFRPNRIIIFGILHFIAFASLVGLWIVRFKYLSLASGATIVFLGLFFESAHFDSALLSWIGFRTHLPTTLDYVPVFPWLGAVTIGIYIGHSLIENSNYSRLLNWKPKSTVSRVLIWAGKNSLNIYMLHVPILFIMLLPFIEL